MKRLSRLVLSFATLPLLFVAHGSAQEVHNTSYSTKTGERVLRIETIVSAPLDQVWNAWTTPDGLKEWIAPVVAIDFRIGGTISTNYDSKAKIGESGTITLPIVNYIEKQLLTLRVNLTDSFARKVRDEDQNLQEIVQIADIGNGKTKLVSSMVGWGTGKEWDDTYAFFARGNEWTYQQLAKYLSPPGSARKQVIKIVTQIQRADYEGDRAALKRLYGELAPFAENKELAARVRYWRGFALWRRVLNGFNDSVDSKEQEADLKQALEEFDKASAKDPTFVDAKVGTESCLGFLIGLNPNDAPRVQELMARGAPLRKEIEEAAPENPRFLWVQASILWYVPPERGGGQATAMETYQKGLEAARKQKGSVTDPLEPSWGEPELLMSLAGANFYKTAPDLNAAGQYARSALELVPYWHYVRDILIPQIQEAKKKPH
jgi:uncharacterized protein YndB with AHSA1/START domain